ncbi:MAG: AmmeMemoRadiSam system radical SAM enzyme [bacterium]
MQKALFYEVNSENNYIKCRLCPHDCVIKENDVGFCRVRKNLKGDLISLVYGLHASVGVDPIEKKPLYHFYPGRDILSFGTLGCNMSCQFCQNWSISQADFDEKVLDSFSPEKAVRLAKEKSSIGIAYTYNEPLINYEWVLDTAKLAKKEGLKNVLITNGFINEVPLMELIPFIDAVNVDVKAFRNEFYKKFCSGDFDTVKRSVELFVEAKVHVELTTLLITGENDSYNEIKQLVDWIASLSPYIPLHFSRYFPNYKFSRPQTQLDTLIKAYNLANNKLKYVFLGNVNLSEGSNTFCPECGEVLIERAGYSIKGSSLKYNRCGKCKAEFSSINIINK